MPVALVVNAAVAALQKFDVTVSTLPLDHRKTYDIYFVSIDKPTVVEMVREFARLIQ